MCLSARLSERGWIYGLSTKVLEFSEVATTFFALCHLRRLFGGGNGF